MPVPALVTAEQFEGCSGGWLPTSAAPDAAPPTPTCYGAGQLRGLPPGLHRGHPQRQRHPISLLPLPGPAGAGGLRPRPLLSGAVYPRRPARRAGLADLCAVLQRPELVAQALERAHSGAWVPQELRRRQATLRQVRDSVARQRQRLLEAYLAEVIDLDAFQRQDRTLAGQQADPLAREREVAAQGERLAGLSAIAHSMTAVLEQLRMGLDRARFQQRRQLVELLIDRVLVTDGRVEIRYVIPTTTGTTKTRSCHLRTDYFDDVAALIVLDVERRRSSTA